MTVQRVNITLDPDLFKEFKRCAKKDGISISGFVASNMEKYIEKHHKEEAAEKEYQEFKQEKGL